MKHSKEPHQHLGLQTDVYVIDGEDLDDALALDRDVRQRLDAEAQRRRVVREERARGLGHLDGARRRGRHHAARHVDRVAEDVEDEAAVAEERAEARPAVDPDGEGRPGLRRRQRRRACSLSAARGQ